MSYRYSDYDKISGGAVRRYLARLFLALCVIGVGVGYIGNQVSFLPWENFTLFFPGWGSLFLIVPAVYFLLRNLHSRFVFGQREKRTRIDRYAGTECFVSAHQHGERIGKAGKTVAYKGGFQCLRIAFRKIIARHLTERRSKASLSIFRMTVS